MDISKNFNQLFKNDQPEQADGSKSKLLATVMIVVVVAGGLTLINSFISKKDNSNTQPEESKSQTENSIATQSQNFNSISQANDYFGFNLIKSLNQKDKNTFISPLSISTILDLTANGAKGITQTEMFQTLGLSSFSPSEINSFNSSIQKSLKSDANKEILVANSIWVDNTLPVLQIFKDLAINSYSAQSQNLDFNKSSSADTINSWVLSKTNNKIKNIVDKTSLSQMKMILINAIYFKSNWLEQFNSESTKKQDFNLENNTKISRDLMNKTDSFSYYEDKNFQAIKLPYRDTNLSMLVFMPAKNQKIDDFVNGLDWEIFNSWIEKLDTREGHLALPKFKIEYENKLNDDLEKLGIETAFDCNNGSNVDFSAISNKELCISEVKHKSFIEVDEKGTEAAAATSVGMKTVSSSIKPDKTKPFEMIVDRPFFFVIRDQLNDLNLFSGIIKNPAN